MSFLQFVKEILIGERRGLFLFQADQQDLPPTLLETVNRKTAVANVRRIVPFAAIIFLIEVLNQLTLCLTTPESALRTVQLAAGAAMLLLTACAIALSYRTLKGPGFTIRRCKVLYRVFWWLFSLGMLTFVCLELYTRGSTNNFIYLLILTATFPLLPGREALGLFGVDTAVMICFAVRQGLSPQQMIQFPLIAVFAWILSRILYSSYRMNGMMVEQLRVSNQKLTDLAQTDPLTGLLNRRGVQERLQGSLARLNRPVRVAFLMIDIDLFKSYNDRFGHEQGDQCLVRVAEAVQHCVRNSRDLASRFGGEEFLVALIDCEEADARRVAQRLRREVLGLGLEAASDAVHRYVTVSVGAATAVSPFDFTELYEQADRALYLAKNSNRNCVVMDGKVCRDD